MIHKFFCLFALTAAFTGIANAEPWHYTLGEQRADQQANFCLAEEDVIELARIFEEYGPKPGYSALAHSRNCTLAVGTFTPIEIVKEIVVEKNKPNEYTISFVEVKMADGKSQYLMTTRKVKVAN
ncbi:MAG: hypothetical protein ACR2RB_14995 [Gammaproteobacteria bacterium]